MKPLLALFTVLLLTGRVAGAAVVEKDGFFFSTTASGACYEGMRLSTTTWWGIDVVIIPDGFTDAQLPDARTLANTAMVELLEVEPFRSHKRAFNFWFVRHVCPDGESALVCHASERFPICSEILSEDVFAASGVPGGEVIVVATTEVSKGGYWQGDGSPLVYVASASLYGSMLAHEMGHVLAGLGDEYRCFQCDGSTDDADYCKPDDLGFPNLTNSLDVSVIPWGDRIDVDYTTLPTVSDSACNGEEIGAWEGGGYCETGVYRPQEYCLMDGTICRGNDEFCVVCADAVEAVLPVWTWFGDMVGVYALGGSMKLGWARFDGWVLELPPAELERGLVHDGVLRLDCSPAVSAPGARLLIITDTNAVVGTGTSPGAGRFSVEFTVKSGLTYYAVFYPGPRIDTVLSVNATYTVDGIAQDLR